MNIARRLGLAAALSAFLVVAAAGAAVASLASVERQQAEVAERELPIVEALEDVRASTLRIAIATNEYAALVASGRTHDDPEPAAELQRIANEAQNLVSSLARLSALGAPDAELDAKAHALVDASASFRAVMELGASSDVRIAAARAFYDQAQDAMMDAADAAVARQAEALAAGATSAERAATIGVVASILGALAFTAIAFISWRTLVRPIGARLRDLELVALRIGKGDYAARATTTGNDEVSHLADALAHMSENLEASRDQLIRSDRLSSLGTLVAGVAHEINNPLQYIRGNVEIVESDVHVALQHEDLAKDARAALEDATQLIQPAMRGLDRIGHITRSLKAVARSSHGERKHANVNSIVQSVITVAHARLHPNVRLVTDLASRERPSICEDEIAQVVLNLIINANDAMLTTGGQIDVSTRDDADSVVIEIRDHGPGISAAARAKIFTPFFTTKPTGTGLGLSIAHTIVQDHGGSLTFENAREGGAAFRVRLPTRPPAGPGSPPSLHAGPQGS